MYSYFSDAAFARPLKTQQTNYVNKTLSIDLMLVMSVIDVNLTWLQRKTHRKLQHNTDVILSRQYNVIKT